MEKQKKIGLVVEGGGMKCAYNAGILDAFLDHNITFDYCIGVSGGAGNVASYVAGQRGRKLRFFTDHIHSSKYFGINSLFDGEAPAGFRREHEKSGEISGGGHECPDRGGGILR